MHPDLSGRGDRSSRHKEEAVLEMERGFEAISWCSVCLHTLRGLSVIKRTRMMVFLPPFLVSGFIFDEQSSFISVSNICAVV